MFVARKATFGVPLKDTGLATTVSHTSGRSITSQALTIPAGAYVFVIATVRGGNTDTMTLTSSDGQTWSTLSSALAPSGTSHCVTFFGAQYAAAPSGSVTITLSCSSGSSAAIEPHIMVGVNAAPTIGATLAVTGGSAYGSITPQYNGSLIYGVAVRNTNGSPGTCGGNEESGWTSINADISWNDTMNGHYSSGVTSAKTMMNVAETVGWNTTGWDVFFAVELVSQTRS